MKPEIYLDNAATTMPAPAVLEKINSISTRLYANPSALHLMGVLAEDEFIKAKNTICKALNIKSKNLYFTSGGTESNNTLIFGAVNKLKRYGNHIVTGSIEHPSVLNPIKELEKQGFKVTVINAGKNGYKKEDIINAITKDTILVSLMTVNNETGIINDLSFVKEELLKKGSKGYFHSDCVQAFLKTKIDINNYDLISLSAHKISGPKGIGAMYVGKEITPLLFGGGQQQGIRSGTIPTELICGFAAAVLDFKDDNIIKLNNYAREKLAKYKINSPINASPYILIFFSFIARYNCSHT